MGLDVYVGALTRYYAGQWETLAARTCHENGIPFETVRASNPSDAVTDPAEIEPVVTMWREGLSRSLQLPEPLAWPEGMASPYFTDKPDWDGFAGLLLWAAYEEQPSLSMPVNYLRHFEDDPAFKASTANGFKSRYMDVLTCELWLPGDCNISFRAEDVTGGSVWMAFSNDLLTALADLNQRIWRAADAEIRSWRGGELPHEGGSFEDQAKFGFSIIYELATAAVRHGLPMKLDY